MEFWASYDFVIIVCANLRLLKQKKKLLNCIIFRHFNPATLIEPPLLKMEGKD